MLAPLVGVVMPTCAKISLGQPEQDLHLRPPEFVGLDHDAHGPAVLVVGAHSPACVQVRQQIRPILKGCGQPFKVS